MSEKQFKLSSETVLQYQIMDNDTDLNENEVCDLLNTQQATIQSLKEDKAIAEDYANIFEKENVKLRKQIGEQQATITTLKEENEQLRENLHNCRLNKNIIREKLKLWQDAHKEYNIYSIKDFEESFELDAKINKEKGI